MSSILTHGAIIETHKGVGHADVVEHSAMREILRMVGFDSRKCVSIMGAVVGYGFALQAYCLEGFDSLGLHQIMYL